MARQFNIWSLYLCGFCLIVTLHLAYATFNQTWRVAPPAYIVWLFFIMCFTLGIIGFRYKNSRLARLRSWLTVITSFFLLLVLFLAVIRPLIISEQLIEITHSPGDTYTINLYLTNGGATTSFGVKGVIDGPLWFRKTIYSDYNMDHAHVEWKNNYTVTINNHVLNLKKGETYSD